MNLNRFPKPERKKDANEASDIEQIERVAEALRAEEERRGLKIPEGGPELKDEVRRILAEQENG